MSWMRKAVRPVRHRLRSNPQLDGCFRRDAGTRQERGARARELTGGDKTIEVHADRINLDFVLGNRVMVGTVNANREYFESGVRDMAQSEVEYPGWLETLLTNPVKGLENFEELFRQLTATAALSRCTAKLLRH